MLPSIKNIMNIIRIFNKITSITIKDNDVHIKFKGDLLLESNNLFLYSKDGVLVTKHKIAHFNPELKINNIDIQHTKYIAENEHIAARRKEVYYKLLDDTSW